MIILVAGSSSLCQTPSKTIAILRTWFEEKNLTQREKVFFFDIKVLYIKNNWKQKQQHNRHAFGSALVCFLGLFQSLDKLFVPLLIMQNIQISELLRKV